MAERNPLTIEILGTKDGTPVVLDRVVGGSIYLDEAKRIGQRLLERVEGEASAYGYRILSPNHELIYEWQVARGDGSDQVHGQLTPMLRAHLVRLSPSGQ